jgi:hypothetical protein
MRRIVLVPVVLIALLGAALAANAAIAAQEPKAPKACNKPRIEPPKIVIACADFGLYVTSIEWKYWGQNKAKGTGILVEEGRGQWFTKLTLQKDRVRNCDGYHGRIFKTLKLNFPRAAPPYADDVAKNRLFCIDK